MRRPSFLLILLLLPMAAQAQPVPDWLARWTADQRAAHRGLVSVVIVERSDVRMDRADGTRSYHMESELRFGGGPEEVMRKRLTMNGRPVDPPPQEAAPRRTDPPAYDLLAITDRLVRPLHLILSMKVSGEPEAVEWSERPAMRLTLVSDQEDATIPRISAWFDRETAALLQIRAFIGGQRGTALNVSVVYRRVGGLDLPARRRSEGSLTTRRREREFASLVDVTAEYLPPRIERD